MKEILKKKLLEDEEIETLLKELPSSDKLKSLTEGEKIKILKATSDEKNLQYSW